MACLGLSGQLGAKHDHFSDRICIFIFNPENNGGIGDFDRSQGIEWRARPRGDDASQEIPVYNLKNRSVPRESNQDF